MAETRREGIPGIETALRKSQRAGWNAHFLDTELSGNPIGERGHYLRINS